MKRLVIFVGLLSAIVFVGIGVTVIYVHLTNRTIDQSLATNLTISNQWTEISADPPLAAFRMVQELSIEIPNYEADFTEDLPKGQVRLPDGRIVVPEIQGLDTTGQWHNLDYSGRSRSQRDLVNYRLKFELDGNALKAIRIKSDESFSCEEIFWRNRNPK